MRTNLYIINLCYNINYLEKRKVHVTNELIVYALSLVVLNKVNPDGNKWRKGLLFITIGD
jgi:hypothetical protein